MLYNIWGILMVNVTIYSIHGSYGYIYIQSAKSHSNVSPSTEIFGALCRSKPKNRWQVAAWCRDDEKLGDEARYL